MICPWPVCALTFNTVVTLYLIVLTDFVTVVCVVSLQLHREWPIMSQMSDLVGFDLVGRQEAEVLTFREGSAMLFICPTCMALYRSTG